MLSSAPKDKLHTIATFVRKNDQVQYPKEYVDACAQWYASLSESERLAAVSALGALNRGDRDLAFALALSLPPAPVFP